MSGDGEAGVDRDDDAGASNAVAGRAMEYDRNERGNGSPAIECSVRIGGVDFSLVPAGGGAGGVGRSRERAHAKGMTRMLWEARREAGLTQAQLARRLGVSQAMVSQAESGRDVVGGALLEESAGGVRASFGLGDGGRGGTGS